LPSITPVDLWSLLYLQGPHHSLSFARPSGLPSTTDDSFFLYRLPVSLLYSTVFGISSTCALCYSLFELLPYLPLEYCCRCVSSLSSRNVDNLNNPLRRYLCPRPAILCIINHHNITPIRQCLVRPKLLSSHSLYAHFHISFQASTSRQSSNHHHLNVHLINKAKTKLQARNSFGTLHEGKRDVKSMPRNKNTTNAVQTPNKSEFEKLFAMDSYPQHQVMGQSPFFYYNPDPKPDNRQHGHFSQQPNNVQVPVYHPHVQPMPSTPIYSRPNSSCSQPPMHPKMYNTGYPVNMTPMASPRPMYQKPTILIQEHAPRMILESDAHEGDMYFYPSTPPLSASGSAISSPSSCDIIPTPVNAMFFGLEGFEGVKEGCEGEVQSENLAGGDWARCGSPPLTPGMFNPHHTSESNCLYILILHAYICVIRSFHTLNFI
jgi:hypothetical protein